MSGPATAFDREKLDALVAEGWLRSQRHPDADLWIYNYTERTQYEGHWTPETLACRGLILDGAGEVVARPFGKFFNLGDPQVGELPQLPYRVTEKIDGSLGIYYQLDGEGFLATRGSFTSEQAREGTAMLRDCALKVHPMTTPLFEIVYPENRIVVDYGDRRELIFLTAIDNVNGRDTWMPFFSGPSVEQHEGLGLYQLAAVDRPNCEGYVVTFKNGLRVKVKHAEYVRLHKLITGVNARHIWEILKEGGDLEAMLDGIPDELYEWISETRRDLLTTHAKIANRCAVVFEEAMETIEESDRKALAAYFQATGANTSVLFRMLDGKPYDDLIWKAIKPEPTTPDTIWTRRTEVAA